MSETSQRTRFFIAFLFAVGVVAVTFSQIFTDPGHFIPSLWGDSAKNMFSYLYHTQYGRGIWFTGMNYPYGEHIVYMDAQPLLSVPLSYLKGISVSGALTVMWYALIGSYILAIIYVYKILLHYKVKELPAMLFSGLIVVMSPQLFRSLAHFGLSYACVVPMLFYWTIQYNISARWKYAAYILILGLLATFIHPYHSAIVLLWVVWYVAASFIFSRTSWKQKMRHVLPLLLSILFLFGIVGIIMKVTDPWTDRARTPYGLTEYCTTGDEIFTSHYSPVWKYLEDKGAVQNTSLEEGFTYPGISVIAALISALVLKLTSIRKNKSGTVKPGSNSFGPIWLFIAFGALLLGMGVPFVWHMEWIVSYLSFLRQFRTLGRFSWIFYYIATIYGAVVIYACYAKFIVRGKRIGGYAILTAAVSLWCFEASGYIAAERDAIKNDLKNYDTVQGASGNNWLHFLSTHHYNAHGFQAILLLPVFNISMDKLWLGNDTGPMEIGEGFVAGMQLQLPIMDAMAHSSWTIAERQARIAGGPFADKQVLKDLPNGKPLLILNNEQQELDADQKYLLAASDFIGTFNSWRAYACYPERIKANDTKYRDSVKAIIPYLKNGDTCIQCSGTWIVNHFDSGNSKEKFFGTEAKSQIMQFETIVADLPMKVHPVDGLYEFSCWFLLSNEDYRSPYFKLDLLDAAGNVLQTIDVLTKESTDNKGLWFRAYKFFHVPANCCNIKCRLFNEPDNTYKIMDELLLRPADALIISRSADGEVMVNNHLLQ